MYDLNMSDMTVVDQKSEISKSEIIIKWKQ